MRNLILGLLLIAPHGLVAGPSSYICQITDFKSPGSDTESREWVGETAKETTVAIDRQTGRVIHPWIRNTSFKSVRLLNRGSSEWSFKAIADSGIGLGAVSDIGGNVRYYEVHEYVSGEAKPFLAVSDGTAFFGFCR